MTTPVLPPRKSGPGDGDVVRVVGGMLAVVAVGVAFMHVAAVQSDAGAPRGQQVAKTAPSKPPEVLRPPHARSTQVGVSTKCPRPKAAPAAKGCTP